MEFSQIVKHKTDYARRVLYVNLSLGHRLVKDVDDHR
jgi:hypothetical protein